MAKYIDAEKLISEIRRIVEEETPISKGSDYYHGVADTADKLFSFIDTLQQEQDKMRYCIEYINPLHPLLDNGVLNIRHLRVPEEHGAEMALVLMLSLGAKIYALYRGNVIDGKLGEWSTPMIVDADDWYSASWLHDILDCGYTL